MAEDLTVVPDAALMEELHDLYLSADDGEAFDRLSERAYRSAAIFSKLNAAGAAGPQVEAAAFQRAADAVAREPVDAEQLGKVRSALKAFRFADADEYRRRKAACDGCEHGVKREAFQTTLLMCRLCGCLMNMKARLEGQHCPAGKF